MLEWLTDPRYEAISTPCQEAVELTSQVLSTNDAPVIAEIGIGVGATSLALCTLLDHRGEAWFFDFEDRVTSLADDLKAAGFRNIRTFGNTRKTFDSYSWTLAVLRLETRDQHPDGLFDFIYLDGAHVCHHDAFATSCAKQLLRPGGYLLMDDYDWTIAKSPTVSPSVNPAIRQHFTEAQIESSHVEMICNILLDPDPQFERVPLGYGIQEHRRAYRRLN